MSSGFRATFGLRFAAQGQEVYKRALLQTSQAAQRAAQAQTQALQKQRQAAMQDAQDAQKAAAQKQLAHSKSAQAAAAAAAEAVRAAQRAQQERTKEAQAAARSAAQVAAAQQRAAEVDKRLARESEQRRRQATREVERLTGAVTRSAQQEARAASQVEQANKRLTDSHRQVGRAKLTAVAAGRQFGVTARGLTRDLGGMLRRVRNVSLAVTGLGGAFGAVGLARMVKGGVALNAQFQSLNAQFSTLIGSDAKAAKFVDTMRSVTSNSALRLTEVLDASRGLIAGGFDPSKMPKMMQGIQNAVLVSGGDPSEKLGRISEILSVIQTRGKLSATEVRRLQQAGVNVSKDLAPALGLTAEQMANVGKEGISAEKTLEGLQKIWTTGKMAKSAENLSKTYEVQLASLVKQREQLQRMTFEPLFRTLNQRVMPALQAMMSDIIATVQRDDLTLKAKVDLAWGSVREHLGPFVAQVREELGKLDVGPTLLAKFNEWAPKVISAIAGAFATAAPKAANAFFRAFMDMSLLAKGLTAAFIMSRLRIPFLAAGKGLASRFAAGFGAKLPGELAKHTGGAATAGGAAAGVGARGSRIGAAGRIGAVGALAGGVGGGLMGGNALEGAGAGALMGAVGGPIGMAAGALAGAGTSAIVQHFRGKGKERAEKAAAEFAGRVREGTERGLTTGLQRTQAQQVATSVAKATDAARAASDLERQIAEGLPGPLQEKARKQLDELRKQAAQAGDDAAQAFAGALDKSKVTNATGLMKRFRETMGDAPRAARESAAKAMVEFAKEQERSGMAPKGAAKRLMTALKKEADKLEPAWATSGKRAAAGVDKALNDKRLVDSARKTIDGIVDQFGQLNGLPRITTETVSGTVAVMRTQLDRLRRVVDDKNAPEAMRKQAREALPKLQSQYDQSLRRLAKRMGISVSEAQRWAEDTAKAARKAGNGDADVERLRKEIARMDRKFDESASKAETFAERMDAAFRKVGASAENLDALSGKLDAFQPPSIGNILRGLEPNRRGGRIKAFAAGGLATMAMLGGPAMAFATGGMVPALVSSGEVIRDPGGSWWQVPGPRVAADNVFTYLESGAEVYTDHGQSLLAAGLGRDAALAGQLPHFAKGGKVRQARVGYTVFSDPPPGAFGSLAGGYAELGTATKQGKGTGRGWLARALGMSGELAEDTPLTISIGGRTATLRKRDRGYGQGGNGVTSDPRYALDVWRDSWAKLGLTASSKGVATVALGGKAGASTRNADGSRTTVANVPASKYREGLMDRGAALRAGYDAALAGDTFQGYRKHGDPFLRDLRSLYEDRYQAGVKTSQAAGRAASDAFGKVGEIKAGGGWAGSQSIVNRLVTGMSKITSRKRAASHPLSQSNPKSDHNEANSGAYAVDIAPGSDAQFATIAKRAGIPARKGAWNQFAHKPVKGYRTQLLWHDPKGGHKDHIHVGVRKLRRGGLVGGVQRFAGGGKAKRTASPTSRIRTAALGQGFEQISNLIGRYTTDQLAKVYTALQKEAKKGGNRAPTLRLQAALDQIDRRIGFRIGRMALAAQRIGERIDGREITGDLNVRRYGVDPASAGGVQILRATLREDQLDLSAQRSRLQQALKAAQTMGSRGKDLRRELREQIGEVQGRIREAAVRQVEITRDAVSAATARAEQQADWQMRSAGVDQGSSAGIAIQQQLAAGEQARQQRLLEILQTQRTAALAEGERGRAKLPYISAAISAAQDAVTEVVVRQAELARDAVSAMAGERTSWAQGLTDRVQADSAFMEAWQRVAGTQDTPQGMLDRVPGMQQLAASLARQADIEFANAHEFGRQGRYAEAEAALTRRAQLLADSMNSAADAANLMREAQSKAAALMTARADFGVSVAQLEIEGLSLDQRLAGTYEGGGHERAAFLRSTVIPRITAAVDASRRAVEVERATWGEDSDQFRAAMLKLLQDGNALKQAQLDEQEEIKRNTADRKFGGSLAFEFGGGVYTDLVLDGAGA